jgi:hypothetical protein
MPGPHERQSGDHAERHSHRFGDPVVVEGVLQKERHAQDEDDGADPQHDLAADGGFEPLGLV